MKTRSAKAKTIKLCKSDLEVIVDEDDYLRFYCFNWYLNDNGYVVTDSSKYARERGVPCKVRLHDLILHTQLDVDHINGNKLDCRKENLREATRTQNMANRKKISKLAGAYFRKGCKRAWYAQISLDGKNKYLGSFYTQEEAHEAFVEAHLNHYGEYSRYED